MCYRRFRTGWEVTSAEGHQPHRQPARAQRQLREELRERNRCRLTMMRAQVMFEEWLTPILDAMVVEQREQGVVWTPSKMIHRMGREIDNPESVYYWCYKNDIPVYSPAITDGSIGDMIFFHSFKTPGLVLDLVQVACPCPASSLSFE